MSTPWLFILLTNPTFNFPPPTWSFLLDNCPAIPELIGATGDSGGNAVGGTAASRNPVSAARARRAAEDRANAVAAAAVVSEINFGPGEKKKQKRHTDTQDIIDNLFSPRRTEASNLEAMVGNLGASLKGSPARLCIPQEFLGNSLRIPFFGFSDLGNGVPFQRGTNSN